VTVRDESAEDAAARVGAARHDVVLAFDLMEHLRDPGAWLAELVANRLRPGSVIVATFPNYDALSRRLLGPLWPQYKLEHLHYFSERGIAQMAARVGLATRRLDPLTKRLPVAYALDVASAFGPALTQRLARVVRAVTPGVVRAATLPFRLGEWLWIAEVSDSGGVA
jgi:hypothetical protein